MDRKFKIIKEYLLKKNTDYAIMLNAEWGYGKTYYITSEIREKIENVENPATKSKFCIMHISLSGISSPHEIFDIIFFQKFGLKKGVAKQTISGLIGKVAEKIGFDKKHIDISDYLDFSNTLVCFDDLERISPKLDVIDVLGFINSNFTEKNKIKCLIIANEEQISDYYNKDISKEQNTKRKYDIVKEKFIFRTIQFEPNIKKIITNFINNIESPDLQKNLKENIDFLTDLIKKTTSLNIRFFQFAIDNLIKIHEVLGKASFTKINQEIFLFTIIVSYEYKMGQFIHDNKISNQGIHEINTEYLSLRNLGKIEKTFKSSNDTYQDRFYEKYIENNFSIYHYFPSIFTLISTGFLDDDKLSEEVKKLISSKLPSNVSEETIYFGKFTNFRYLEDLEFKSVIKKVLQLAEDGKFSPYLYPEILLYFQHFVTNKLTNFKISTINQKLEKGLKKAVTKHNFNQAMRDRLEFSELKSPIVIPLVKEIDKFHLKKKNASNKLQAEEFWKKIAVSKIEDLNYIFSNTPHENQLFCGIEIKEHFEYLLKLNNNKLYRILNFIQSKYSSFSKTHAALYLKEDLIKMGELRSQLIKYSKRYKTNTIKRLHLNEYISILDKIILELK